MANKTKYLQLTKPSEFEFYNVRIQNENLDIIDDEFKNVFSPMRKPFLETDVAGVLPIHKGGTGATSALGAIVNLGISQEYWTFTLEDGTTVTKLVCAT